MVRRFGGGGDGRHQFASAALVRGRSRRRVRELQRFLRSAHRTCRRRQTDPLRRAQVDGADPERLPHVLPYARRQRHDRRHACRQRLRGHRHRARRRAPARQRSHRGRTRRPRRRACRRPHRRHRWQRRNVVRPRQRLRPDQRKRRFNAPPAASARGSAIAGRRNDAARARRAAERRVAHHRAAGRLHADPQLHRRRRQL